MLNISVLVSGGGTNLQALIDAQRAGTLKNGEIKQVISSKPDAFALERARQAGIPSAVIEKRRYFTADEYNDAVTAELDKAETDLVVLAGFLSILGGSTLKKYEGRIINIHPALIPSFCGKGFYGLRVHEAALAKGVKITGATVHFVNAVPDGGAIILQKAVEVLPSDTPETLQHRVMKEAEWELLPKAVSLFCEGRIRLSGDKAQII